MIWSNINTSPRCHFEPFDIASAERSRGAHDRLGRGVEVFLFLVFLSFVFSTYAQQTKDLEGRVFSKDGDVAGTHVINSTTQKATITDVNGFFKIQAKLNDTLVFSAVQYKRKVLPINAAILESRLLNVYLEEGEIKLDEVFVMPYNLTGDLSKDIDSLKIGSIVTASSLGLPNANVKVKTQNERKLFEADNGKFFRIIGDSLEDLLEPTIQINLNKILNRITGRTRMLKKFVAIDKNIVLMNRLKDYYADSLFIQNLGIPKNRINDFMYYCEVDSAFQTLVDSQDRLKLWEFMRKKSVVYRENDNLD